MEKFNIKKNAFIFINRVLLHALAAWSVFNAGDLVRNFYKVYFGLAHTVNHDGSIVTVAQRFINHNFHQPLIPWILLLALLAECNYLFVFKRKSLLWFALSTVALAKIGGGTSLLFQREDTFTPLLAKYIDSTAVVLIYIFSYAVLYNFFYERYQRIKFYKQKSEAELHLLKAQINPHFFFNTLNNIYGIALSEKATKTAGALELLSDMMRYNMDGVREDFIPLKTELKFIEDYLTLQQLRIPANTNITINNNIEYPKINYKIAPMLLIPFIENAWKYGISTDKQGNIDLQIYVEKHQLIMIIENTIFPDITAEKGSGLGIANVQQRLQMIYPGLHQLNIQSDENKYRINLSIVI